MKAWDPQEKKAFRTGAQAFYIATAKHLIKKLPLDNKLLLHLRFLDPSSHLTMEERVQSLKYVAACVPNIAETEQVTCLIDEWHSLHCRPVVNGASSHTTSVGSYWASLLATDSARYPLLSVLVRAMLPLPHGNADCERGFSENKHILDNRSSLAITTINGIRQVKSDLKCYESEPSRVPLTSQKFTQSLHGAPKTRSRRPGGTKKKTIAS